VTNNAIDTLTERIEFTKIQHICKGLDEISCIRKLVEIPGHKGIYGNELADRNAKQLAQMTANLNAPVTNVVSISAARKAAETAKMYWPHKWN